MIGCSSSRAAAVNWTGELSLEPLAGEHMWTVLSTVAEQDRAKAVLLNEKENRITRATSRERLEITRAPNK